MISVLVEEEGVRALCSLVPEDGEKDRASNRGREWGWRGIGAVAAHIHREQSLEEKLEIAELERVRENTENALSSQFKGNDLGVDKLLKEEKIT